MWYCCISLGSPYWFISSLFVVFISCLICCSLLSFGVFVIIARLSLACSRTLMPVEYVILFALMSFLISLAVSFIAVGLLQSSLGWFILCRTS